MLALFCLFLALFASPFKSKSRLEAENAALRHQLIILRRKVRGRVRFTNGDRLFFIQLYRWFPSVLKAITIIRPETLVRSHRGGFRLYWRSMTRERETLASWRRSGMRSKFGTPSSSQHTGLAVGDASASEAGRAIAARAILAAPPLVRAALNGLAGWPLLDIEVCIQIGVAHRDVVHLSARCGT